MNADAAAAPPALEQTRRLHGVLRIATGVTATFLLAEYLELFPTFMAPVLTAVLLSSLPVRPPLKMGLGLVLVMTVAAAYSFLISALFRGTPMMLFGLVGLTMFLCFHGLLTGRPKLPGMLMLICLATVPVVAMVAPAQAGTLPTALVRDISIAIVAIWAFYVLWPLPPAPPAAAPAAADPDPRSPVRLALLSAAVVLPLMFVYLLFGIVDALPVMVATVMLVVNFDVRRSGTHALALILGNFAGGMLGLLLHTLLLTAPTLPFLALMLFPVMLAFGHRMTAGGPSAAVALIACNAMLIILSSAIASGPGSLMIWLTRVFQFALAGAFAMGMLTLLWQRPPRKTLAPPAGRSR